MTVCSNCFLPIEDMRKETRCKTCNKELHKDCAINDGGANCDVCYTFAIVTPPAPKVELPDIIRRSDIETYRSCPYQFYLKLQQGQMKHNNDDEDDGTGSIYAILGRDLHELFEMCQDSYFVESQMIEQFHQLWYNYDSALFDDEKQKEKMYFRGINSISNFYTLLPTLGNPFVLEENIISDLGDDVPKLSITMDRIDESDNGLWMRDWKTGKVLVGQKLKTDLQAPLYIYSVQQKYGKVVDKFIFHYLDENKTRTFERVNDDIYECRVINNVYQISLTEAIREVKSIFSRMKKGDFNIPRDTKKMYFTCKMCEFRQNGACEGADMQSWKNKGEVW